MAATLEVVIVGRDNISAMLGKAKISFASLAKASIGAGLGIHGVESAVQAAKRVLVSSIGAASAYEHQLSQIRALTGSTREDTDRLSASILEMTKEIPKSPAELGAGAYFILSSGITDVTDATKVLNIAAKASTIGLGETQVVADALTTVLNAYGKEAGDAGQVTDVLIQAVKEGKVEGSGFAAVLGRVVPVAAQMGISFEEVAANLATFTRLGVSAEEAATGLRNVMVQILKPSEQAKELLASVGLTMQDLREQIRERGLAAVLQGLVKHFEGNEEAIAKLFPEVRGLTNVLATAGAQGEAYTEILASMGTATGNLERGFADVAETTKFKLDKAMNDLNVALMELGTEALPAVSQGAEDLADVIETTRLTVEAISDLADVVGVDLVDALVNAIPVLREYKAALDLKQAIEEAAKSTRDVVLETAAGIPVFGGVAVAAKVAADEYSVLAVNAGAAERAMAPWNLTADQTADIAADLALQGGDLAGVVGNVASVVPEATDAISDLGAAAEKTDSKVSDFFKDFQDLARDAIKEFLPLEEEFALLADTTEDNADAQEKWNDRVKDLGESLADAEDDFADASKSWGDDLAEMGRDLTDLESELANATDPEDVERLTEKIGDLHRKMGEGRPAIQGLEERIADLREEMGKAPDVTPVIAGFDAWRERVGLLAEEYGGFRDNMQVIMDALVSQNVLGVDQIMAVIREQGPTFAANFAQWFRDDPIAAATTVREIMPGIMGEAATTAINNVLAETSRFNAAWQTDVIDALNKLPEEKKLAITTTVDPQWWLLQAQLALMQPGLNIPLTMDQLIQAGQMPRQHGGPVSAGMAYRVGEAGPELFIAPTNGTIIPNHAMMATSAMTQGGAIAINVFPREGQSEREIAACVRREFTDLQRRGL